MGYQDESGGCPEDSSEVEVAQRKGHVGVIAGKKSFKYFDLCAIELGGGIRGFLLWWVVDSQVLRTRKQVT